MLLWNHKSQRACVLWPGRCSPLGSSLGPLAFCLTPAVTTGSFPAAHSHTGMAVVFPPRPRSVFYRIFHGPMSLCSPIEALALARPHPTVLQEMGCSYVKRIAKHVSQDGMCMHMSMHLCVDSRNSSASAWWQVP